MTEPDPDLAWRDAYAYDAADILWTDATAGEVIGAIVYDDRKLSRWEWVKVKVLRRPDPRVIWTDL